jgi:ribosomal protein S18 acetylase RimI-like enzyme
MFDSPTFSIRRARREDCGQMMTLISELARFERAPQEVTVSLSHFEESGFGPKPVWWAFVACAGPVEAASEVQEASLPLPEGELQSFGMAAKAEQGAEEAGESVTAVQSNLPVEPMTQLSEPVEAFLPDAVQDALPLMQPLRASEEIIGMALCYVRYSTWKGQCLYLEDLIVSEAWRGRGVGKALMEAVIAEAKSQGFPRINWQVLAWNEPAIKFYERLGARFDAEWLNGVLDV